MGNKSKGGGKVHGGVGGMIEMSGDPLTAKQWEEITEGLARIIEVQGKSIEALAKALEVMGVVVVPGGGDGEGREAEEGEEEGGGEEGVSGVAEG